MLRRRAIVGVTGPDAGGEAAWQFTRFAVWLAGGHAVRITPKRPRRITGLDGLIIGGGADVDPELYGEEPHPILPQARGADEPLTVYLVEWLIFPLTWAARKLAGQSAAVGGDRARDALEMQLIDEAVRRRLPILGICRGAQLLNVYFGGSLHQSLAGFYVEDPEVRTILPRKMVHVKPGTKLSAVMGDRPRRVNALHRHAVATLGEGVRVAAADRNGIVQAIEHATLPLVLGVQWHPEYLPQLSEQRAMFEAVVRQGAEAHRSWEETAPAASMLPG
jgi:putative glutamine amidotransferase